MDGRVIIIGGGMAGLSAAISLSEMGIAVTVLEKEPVTGGHVRNWDRLFPNRRKSGEVISFLNEKLDGIDIRFKANITGIRRNGDFTVTLDDHKEIHGNAILLATGYDLFPAVKKEEYGYDIYDKVITSAELEEMFRLGTMAEFIHTPPRRIAFVHCVGSRDEKVGNLYCSKVCCVTGVKQAIEMKELYPKSEIFNFYMDLRMFDRHFEEMYFEAQKDWGINFIRGRVSECSENADKSVVVKLEDTLTGRPMKITVDLLVLLVGMVPRPGTEALALMLGIPVSDDRFLLPADEHTQANSSNPEGVFLAGAVKGPACITSTIADGRAAAMQVAVFLNNKSSQA
jgi:heterodisulfide reductase subunit A2